MSLAGTRFVATPAASVKGMKSLGFVLSSRCSVCVDSMPTIQGIAQEVRRSGAHLRIVAISPEPITDLRLLTEPISLVFDETLKVPDYVAIAQVTPRTVLIDETGVIERDWIGRIKGGTTQAQEILKAALEAGRVRPK